MNKKTKILCDKISHKQFEAIQLLYEVNRQRVVIGCDRNAVKKSKTYRFFDTCTGENYLLILGFDKYPPETGIILKRYPEYNIHTFCDFANYQDKMFCLRWLYKQSSVPDCLKGLHEEVKKNCEFLE